MAKIKKVLFHHGDFEKRPRNHDHFCAKGTIHQQLEKVAGKYLCWAFQGGFIDEHRRSFWLLAQMANVIFLRAHNMNYEDIDMHWNHAEASMLKVLEKIKKINPEAKIFFYEYEPQRYSEFENFGTFITDFHGDEELLEYFKNL